MEQEKYKIVKFVDNGFELEVNVSPAEETVWLTQAEMSLLFNRERSVITKHIKNIFTEGECEEKSNVHFLHIPFSDKPTVLYSLDVIISVGYRVKSQRGVLFRRWATSVLRQYLLKGYAVDPARTLITDENYLNLLNVVTDMKSSQLNLENRVEKLEAKYPELDEKKSLGPASMGCRSLYREAHRQSPGDHNPYRRLRRPPDPGHAFQKATADGSHNCHRQKKAITLHRRKSIPSTASAAN